MTRGKWVALAVGIAAIAVLVPYGPALWRAVAYVEERDRMDIGHSAIPAWDFSVLRKRVPWLPGEDNVIPSQLCRYCWLELHEHCWQPLAGRNLSFGKGSRIGVHEYYLPATFHCTCPDPSHKDKP